LVCIQREPGSIAAKASRSATPPIARPRVAQHPACAGQEEAMHHTFVLGERDAVSLN